MPSGLQRALISLLPMAANSRHSAERRTLDLEYRGQVTQMGTHIRHWIVLLATGTVRHLGQVVQVVFGGTDASSINQYLPV